MANFDYVDIPKSALVRWSQALSGLARTGMSFTESLYEMERFEEILHIAAEIKAFADEVTDPASHYPQQQVELWREAIVRGIPGYVTPKSAVGAIVGNASGEILLIQRSDSGVWLYPTGWADVGYSPAEVVKKEVLEETGIEVEPVRLLSVVDGMQRGFTTVAMYSMIFYCRTISGELKAHPLECRDVGWFARDNLPSPLAARDKWVEMAFMAIDGIVEPTYFDPPRTPFWNG
ncbi:MAG: NUDIX hydrolase N-terminal domain-containing protein [Actinobacteria bacterium]|nr:NUDIX hydrolase N-terminal domain-containing protein [Actinomycetota bacterium]